MKRTSNILVMGDVHGDFSKMNTILNKLNPHITLQTGDFGYWPIFNKKTPISKNKLYWIDGNHEDFYALNKRTTDELWTNIIYKPRCSTLTLPDNRNVLFIGGAISIDKQYRTQGYDWFKEELITQEDMNKMPNTHIDIVISHTVPQFLTLKDLYPVHDPSRDFLSQVYERYKPTLWYAGHFHFYRKLKHDGHCTFTILNDLRSSNSYEWII